MALLPYIFLTYSTAIPSRQTYVATVGLCLLCHSAPIPEERFQGNLAPSLAGAGSRGTPGQLRLRVVDAARLNPDTIMPPNYRVDGLARVAKNFQGKPILTAEQIEDVVAYLVSLKDPQ